MNDILKNFYENNYSNNFYFKSNNESIFKKNGKNIFVIDSDIIKKNKNENDLKNKRNLKRLREKTLKTNRKVIEEISKNAFNKDDDENDNENSSEEDNKSKNTSENLYNEFYIYNLPLKYNKNKEEISTNVGIILKTLLNNKDEDDKLSNEKKEEENLNNTENLINPLKIIQSNLSNEPDNNDLYKSTNLQVKCLGNELNRKKMFNGINVYKRDKEKYKIVNVDIPSNRKKKEKVNIDKIMKKNQIIDENNLLRFNFNINNNINNNKSKKIKNYYLNKNFSKNYNDYASLDERLRISEQSAFETLRLFKLRGKEYDDIKKKLIKRAKPALK